MKQRHTRIAGITALAAVVGWSGLAQAAITVQLNGQPLATAVAPVQRNGRTLIPMRDIFEALGATVQWNALTQGITAQQGASTIQMQIGRREAMIDGQHVTLDQPPMIYLRRTMVPLRFVAEALGADVTWNEALQRVAINTTPLDVPRTGGTVIAQNPAPTPAPVILPDPATPAPVAPAPVAPVPAAPPATPGEPTYYVPGDTTAATPSAPAPAPDYQPAAPTTPLDTTETYPPAPANNDNYRAPAGPRAGRDVAAARTINVPANVVVPVTLDTPLSSATSHVGDVFTASVTSRRMGDSEFPAGSKIEGLISEARPRQGNDPGVLDLDFQTVVLPDGTRVPLRAELIALDDGSVTPQNGRIVAKTGKSQGRGDRLKIIGIGAGAGYLVGKLIFKKDSLLATAIGAAGGYLFSKKKDSAKAAEATLAQGSRLGVRLDAPVNYVDRTGYRTYRTTFLRTNDLSGLPIDIGTTDRSNPPYNATPDGAAYTGYNPDANAPDGNAPLYPPATDNGNDNGYGAPVLDNNPLPGRPIGDQYPAGQYPPAGQPAGQYPPAGQNVAGARTINIPADVVVPVTLDTELSSATAHVGDRFTATVASQRMGDSEFPAGSKIEGTIVEARPHQGDNPGVLDLDFRNVIFPNGQRVPLRAELISLDNNSINTSNGRIVAKTPKSQGRGDKLKVIGIGAGAGYLIGKLIFKKDSLLATVLGGGAGYLYGKHKDNAKADDARLAQGTRLGVRLDQPVSYTDSTGYGDYRVRYLRTQP